MRYIRKASEEWDWDKPCENLDAVAPHPRGAAVPPNDDEGHAGHRYGTMAVETFASWKSIIGISLS